MRVKSAETSCVLDVDGCLARFGGDKELFAEMTAMLVEDAPRLSVQLRAALKDLDASQVESRAHALKGLLVNCGGARAAHIAQQLEDAGRTRNLNKAGPLIEKLDAEFEALFAAVNAYHDQTGK